MLTGSLDSSDKPKDMGRSRGESLSDSRNGVANALLGSQAEYKRSDSLLLRAKQRGSRHVSDADAGHLIVVEFGPFPARAPSDDCLYEIQQRLE